MNHYQHHQHFTTNGIHKHSSKEHQQVYSGRNGMKRRRNESPDVIGCNDDNSFQHNSKRFRVMQSKAPPRGNGIHNNCGESPAQMKSDDEVSLAEEAQTSLSSFPQHTSFTPYSHRQFQPQPQIQRQNQFQHFEENQHRDLSPSHHYQCDPASSSGSTQIVPTSNRPTHATDYQPMNSLLGNLHLMRQQEQQRRRQASSLQEEARQNNGVAPQSLQNQSQHRHYGNYHTMPNSTTTTKNQAGDDRIRKKSVSLRVSSNLY